MNGDSKLIERNLIFDGGVAFGVDKVLIPLGFGGNCDVIKETHIMVNNVFLFVVDPLQCCINKLRNSKLLASMEVSLH